MCSLPGRLQLPFNCTYLNSGQNVLTEDECLRPPVHLPAFPEEETSQEDDEEPRDGRTAGLLMCTGSASLHVLED